VAITYYFLFCTLLPLQQILGPGPCVFPFIYHGKAYNSCTEVASKNCPSCATIANYDVFKQWEYCATAGLTNLYF
ncbi:MMP9: Matrix metalloproteinase-9, partial [Crotalus adamanteus]